MNIARTLKVFSSSCVVYVVMAACASAPSPLAALDSGLLDSSVVPDGSGPAPDARGIMDVLLDPVTEAAAAPPDVATEQCNKTFMAFGLTYIYAEHAYPGKLMAAIAPVHVYMHAVNNITPVPPEYAFWGQIPSVRDGFAMAICGTQGRQGADSAMFVLP